MHGMRQRVPQLTQRESFSATGLTLLPIVPGLLSEGNHHASCVWSSFVASCLGICLYQLLQGLNSKLSVHDAGYVQPEHADNRPWSNYWVDGFAPGLDDVTT